MTITGVKNRNPRAEGNSNGLFAALLGGLLGEPVSGSQLGQAFHGPTGFEPGDGVDQVFVGIDAENETVVDERAPYLVLGISRMSAGSTSILKNSSKKTRRRSSR